MVDKELVLNIRSSTRDIVQYLGYLNNLFERIGSVSQCYALQKLEACPLTIYELSQQLSLERSSVSRLAKELVTKGYCEYLPNEDDGRSRYLRLTHLGQQQLKKIHSMATTQVKNALLKLTIEEQETVRIGLSLYAGALKGDVNE